MKAINDSQLVKSAPSLIAALLLGCAVMAAYGQAAVTNAPPPPNPWESSAAAGLTLTKGNSDTLLVTVGLDTKRKWDKNEAAFGIAAGYGENNQVKNNEFINGFGQYNRLFSQRFYGGLRVDGNYDGIAGLDYRITISPLGGYYLIKETNTTLSVEAGPSYVWEKYETTGQDNYWGVRFGDRFDHKLTASTKIWEAASYVPKVDNWTEKYVITAEFGIDTAISKAWSLRVVLQDIYDSQPAPGRKNNDIRLVAGTAYKF
jgi:putative salt-induced outer membrane protein YdiY